MGQIMFTEEAPGFTLFLKRYSEKQKDLNLGDLLELKSLLLTN